MHVENQLAILSQLAAYAYTYDGRDLEGFLALFTPDAVMRAQPPGENTTATAAVADLRVHLPRRWATELAGVQSRHYVLQTVFLSMSEATAHTRSMVLVTHQHAGEAGPRLQWTGVYEDQWQKTAVGWQIADHLIQLDQQPPGLS